MPEIPAALAASLADRYRLTREIGRGGMAVVYEAVDLRYQRPVALKLYNAERQRHQGAERFRREILLTARLQHPHILTVLDSGIAGPADSEQGQLWYTMPLVEGESLHDRLERERRLPVDDAIRICREVALALEYAHGQGIVHRDIKPENILLTRDGVTLVVDFGIAQALGGIDRLTQQGTVMGSPLYMSPEQTHDQAVDGRSDCYALAAVLFEMLTGEPPFPGTTLHAIAERRATQPTPSARTIRPEVPIRVDTAIRRALSLRPDDRFPTVTAFSEALVTGETGVIETATDRFRTMPPISRTGVYAALALLGIVMLALGVRSFLPTGRPAHAVPVVAVLPFDNLGDSADGYFADGVADEVRAKLAQLPGLELIARGSSEGFRGSRARPAEIAEQLNADYLLMGTVRWEKRPDGSRVRVTPELIDARTAGAAKSRWAEPFEAALTDVFQVQTDIASRVAEALGVALADSTRRLLHESPTVNLAAYDAFLQAEAAAGGMRRDQRSLRRAVGLYRQAVTLDSTFALAWAQLSRALSAVYSNGVPDRALGEEALAAAKTARRLNPREVAVYLAAGDYYQGINPIDNAQAVAAYEEGLRLAPDNPDLLSAAASTQTSLGLWDAAALRLARAAELDPRSVVVARRLATVETFRRNYTAADVAAQRALALAPDNPGIVLIPVLVDIARGNKPAAQAVIRQAARRIDPGVLYPFFAVYLDLYWLLPDSAQEIVLAAPPAAFDDDTASWALARAELHHLRGQDAEARIYADSARRAVLTQIKATPEDAQRQALLGLALAYLGQRTEAVRAGRRGVSLLPAAKDGYNGPYVQLQLARIHLLLGQNEPALDQLEALLRMPFYLSAGWLRIDPTFAQLKGNPRFERLVGGGT